MKKREISKLSLNKKQISILNFHDLRGGKLALAVSDNCTKVNTCDCDTGESECLACNA